MTTSRFWASRWLENLSGRLPLVVKLPLLLSGVLAVVLGIAMIATYQVLRATALDRAHDRVQRATRQLALQSASNIAVQQQTRYARAANDSLVRRALRGERVDASRALSPLSVETDSGTPVELWTRDGRRVAFVGNDLPSTMTVAPGRSELPEPISRLGDARQQRGDSIQYGPLYGEGNRVHFWIVMPVRERGRDIGYIAHQRRIVQNPATMRTLRELAGDSVALYYRNVDGSFWASAGGFPVAGHVETDTVEGIAISADGARLIVNEARIGSTPFVLGMSLPERAIVSRAIRPVRTILLLSLGLLVVGGLAAWAIGRRIATPLSDITQAAGLLASGDFAARVPEQGDPEIRRLAQSFNHMASQIGESRRALERQTAEARVANNAKSDFLTMMSHELRTPLNAIGGYVELLEMELRGPLTSAQKRDLERIKASQQHLLGLISGVLDLARVEAGKATYDIEDIALAPFLSGLDALIAPQAAAKELTLDYRPCAPECAVRADREKLRQILLNLLSNAIRHTPAGGRVTLSAATDGPRVQIAVEDTGSGVPAGKHEEIFEPFVQLDRSLSHPREGLGLGLAISRDLARGMSGDLTVDSSATTGARFLVTLERGNAESARALSLSGEMPAVR